MERLQALIKTLKSEFGEHEALNMLPKILQVTFPIQHATLREHNTNLQAILPVQNDPAQQVL